MWNWFTYFLTTVMALMLIVGGCGCGCAHSQVIGEVHDALSKAKTSDLRINSSCSHGGSPDDEHDCHCQCDCDEIAEHDRSLTKPIEAAVATHNELDGFKLPVLQPRFKALLAVWFADVLKPLWVREPEAVVALIDPGPPRVDVPIYLQVQNLRL